MVTDRKTNRRKGLQYERDLANKFWENGFAVIRAPASGAGLRKRFTPDLTVIYKGRIIILELKYRSKPTVITLPRSRVEKMLDFAKRAGAEPYVAVKYGSNEWRFIPLDSQCVEKDSTCIKIRPEHVEKHGLTFHQLVEKLKSRDLFEP